MSLTSFLKVHSALIAGVFLGFAVLLLVIFVIPSLAFPAPSISWTPNQVVKTAAPGGQKITKGRNKKIIVSNCAAQV